MNTKDLFGKEIRLERQGREVRLIFLAATLKLAAELHAAFESQLREGILNIKMVGDTKPVVIDDSRP